ncbi:hypothetical protein QAD02_017843 [Eretmocerus hayati]|uniref:Uncharacterized protein n=1 Tax=Eretmocerus hayati TaxID=131215 RepID=A0ACC2PG97_9HYME|nr:hypothetical protein QAD02_017843 [Eretmocerus hayati]
MDNLDKQAEEIEALSAIYGEEFQIEDAEHKNYSVRILSENNKDISVTLYVKFPESYPSESPPTFQISAPHLSHSQKMHLSHLLEEEYLSSVGENVIYQWVERIREELQSFMANPTDEVLPIEPWEVEEIPINNEEDTSVCPTIVHGEVILDRKSSFQGHAAVVFSSKQVRQVINKLKENKKIYQATHNMYAFRIFHEENKNFIHDCDDDGEIQAGSRLLHLLEIMNAKNVFVMVSRWYGGIHLGPDRFRHINNAAREVLTSANMITSGKK